MGGERDAHVSRVRDYYDGNIHRFLKFGHSGAADAVRRAVWAPGVKSRERALDYVNELILEELNTEFPSPDAAKSVDAASTRVLDLGCGVGGSLFYLAERRPLQGLGINIGGEQIALARAKARERKFFPEAECEFRQASYLEPVDSGPFQLTFCVEAFACSPDGPAFFRAASAGLAPGGVLIICDDFLREPSSDTRLSAADERILGEFRAGWLARTLISPKEAGAIAAEQGLLMERRVDLTPYLELGRPRDRLISLLVRLGRPLKLNGPAWKNMLGGNALQQGLRDGLLDYQFLVFRKQA